MISFPRASILALSLSLSIGGCGTTNSALPVDPNSSSKIHCDPKNLGSCEQTILSLVREGRDAKREVDAYVGARGKTDPWFVLWNQLKTPTLVPKTKLVASEVGDPFIGRARPNAEIFTTDHLPSPVSMKSETLLMVFGETTHLDVILWIRKSSNPQQRESAPPEVLEIFPKDPLAPFMAGLPPVIRDDKALEHLDADIDLLGATDYMLENAAKFRYVEAARAAERVEQLLQACDPQAEPSMRARYALSLVASAGISFESSSLSAKPFDPVFPDAATSTPYGDLLRVRAAKDDRAAFQKVGERIVVALSEDKRAAMRAMFAPREACLDIPIDGFDAPDDLFLANTIGRKLNTSLGSKPSSTATLGLTEWLPKYEALVRNVDEAQSTWAHAFALTQERGEIGGVSLAGTPTHKRVNELVSAHIGALSQLVQTHPERARLMSIVTLAYARGIIGTPTLRDALVDLLRRSVETRMSVAPDASTLFESSLAGVLAATAYPAAIQGPVYSGLFTAFHDKLKKDFSKQTGWSVAGLFAADAAAGFLAGNPPDLGPVASEISRALNDPALPERPLGRVVAASARYLALGVDKQLDPDAVDPARWPASRKAARDALREAITGLNDPSAPLSATLLDDVAMLGDQTMAALATILQDKPSGSGPVCSGAATGPSPAARRVLVRVGELRQKVLANPSLAKGGPSVGRLRFALTLLSDVIDLASRKKKDAPIAFTVSDAEAERAANDALGSWEKRDIASVIASSYGIARKWLSGTPAKGMVGADVDRSRKLITSLASLLRDDTTGTSVTLFDALSRAAAMRATASNADAPVELLFVEYARSLRALGKPDQADLCLLGAMVAAVISEHSVRDEAIAAADESSSDLGWTLRFAREVYKARKGLSPDPTAYASGMRQAVTRSCEDPAIADQVVQVMDAMRIAASGDRAKARRTLESFLTNVEQQGFALPRMNYKYEEKTASKVFSTSLEVSLGAGFVNDSSRFQVGLGIRSPGQPEGSIEARLLPDNPERDTEMVRYYVHVGAAAALMHFLDGDPDAGAARMGRVIDAAFFGLRLGSRSVVPADPKTTAADARGVLAVVAVLAADAGMPLLAGDIWSLIRTTLASDTDDQAITDILGNLPVALSAVSSAPSSAKSLEKAKRGLRVVAEPLACTNEKVELGGYEAPACDEYPYALALRAGGALNKLPHLRRDPAKSCPTSLASLDTFLVGVEKGGYDPDAFSRAVVQLVSAGHAYDAGVLLARQRQPTHCNPALVTAARSVGRSPAVGRSLRADVLSVAINCSQLDDATLDDIALVDAETRGLADRGRNLSLLAFAAELAIARGRWDVLGRLTKDPTFVSRWLDTNPKAAMFAAVLARAAAIMNKEPNAAVQANDVVDLFCVKLSPVDPGACAAIAAMQRAAGTPEAEKVAKDSVDGALQRLSALRMKR